jgi:hypothetical protein
MDDDKNIIEKTIEAVKDVAYTASEAAKHAMEPEPIKPGEEVVMLAPQGTLLGEPAMPPFVFIPRMPPFVIIPRKKSGTKKASKKTAKKTTKKTAKKSAKKRAVKKWKSPAKVAGKKSKQSGRKAVKKKKAKKSRR